MAQQAHNDWIEARLQQLASPTKETWEEQAQVVKRQRAAEAYAEHEAEMASIYEEINRARFREEEKLNNMVMQVFAQQIWQEKAEKTRKKREARAEELAKRPLCHVMHYGPEIVHWIEDGCMQPFDMPPMRCFDLSIFNSGKRSGYHHHESLVFQQSLQASKNLYNWIVSVTPQLQNAIRQYPNFPHWWKFWTWKGRPCRTYGVPRAHQIMILDSLFKYRYIPMDQLVEVPWYTKQHVGSVMWPDDEHYDTMLEPNGFTDIMQSDLLYGDVYWGIHAPYP